MDYWLAAATDRQIEQICEIWESGWHEAHDEIVPSKLCELRTPKSFVERAVSNLCDTRVAIYQRSVLGFYIVKEDELYQMYVSRHARGSGVAQSLINDAEKRILANGHNTAWLACAVGNNRAARFYEKSGWFNSGRKTVNLDTSAGRFPLEVLRFEKNLDFTNVR